jgi:hypothetical protein
MACDRPPPGRKIWTRTGYVSAARFALHDVAGAERGQRAQYIIKQQIRDEERRAEVVAEDGIDE